MNSPAIIGHFTGLNNEGLRGISGVRLHDFISLMNQMYFLDYCCSQFQLHCID